MSAFLFLSDSFRHPVQFAAGALDLALCLPLLCRVHLRQRLGEPAVGTLQDGQRHLQIAFHLFPRGRLRRRQLPLCFQKQFRFGENALANHARAFAPGCVKRSRLSCIAAVLHEYSGHAFTVVRADPRHRHQILHRDLRCDASFAHMALDRFRQ
jgi:hypothetical protein